MATSTQETVRELAVRIPGATRIFEKAGIDYCCGGNRSLHEACGDRGIDVASLVETLDRLATAETPGAEGRDLAGVSLGDLITHIVETHHIFTVDELQRLDMLLAKVCAAHGANRPELAIVANAFAALRDELLPHMMKEERVLFPYVKALESAAASGGPAPFAPFGTVRNPVRMMTLEHETAGDLLVEIRAATGGFELPSGACMSFKALYEGLEGLERDLHEHIHLENNVLFPRAAALEEAARRDA